MLNRKAEDTEGLTGPIIAGIIITVVAVAGITFFVLYFEKGGENNIDQNINTILYNATDLADCMLWAAGAKDDFDCTKTFCMHDTICKACEHYGEYYDDTTGTFKMYVNKLGCKLSDANKDGMPDNFAGCDSCE